MPNKKLCSYCNKRPLLNKKNSKTCGNIECIKKYDREYAIRWTKENPEKHREKNRIYYKKNKEKIKKAVKKWEKANPKKVKEKKRKWAKENSEVSRKWAKENIKKAREAVRKWQKDNPEKARKAVKKSLLKNPKLWEFRKQHRGYQKHLGTLFQKQKGICALCHKEAKNPSVDHIYPVNLLVKAEVPEDIINDITNLQMACFICNIKKGNKIINQSGRQKQMIHTTIKINISHIT